MRSYLRKGHKLNNAVDSSYTIQEVMGEGGSCIAYRATVDSTGNECVIKEYYPLSLDIIRKENGDIECLAPEREKYDEGINRYIDTIANQITLRNEDSISNQTFYVIDRFRQNNTYYVVVPFFYGETYRNNSEMNLYDRIRVCRSVADYVSRCHKAGYLCLDIKPDNILVIPETPEFAMFFDFDSVCKVSDISFGRTSSFTEKWAAPEQILPSSYDAISYGTDVYILGELIFWSVFDRHSKEIEHRRKSKYRFYETRYAMDISDDAEDIMEDIFHNTLRSSVGNRYDSIDLLLKKIDELLIAIYPGKETLLSLMPSTTTFFVGREKELGSIVCKLNEGHKVFLTGVGGIGKSEIAKHYVEKYKEDYRSIIYLTYSVDLISTINNALFISDFERKEQETEIHYCNRKLSKLAELYSGKNLLIIDNLNIEIEDIVHKDIWERICSLPCDLIITSRCNQEAYYRYQLHIDGLDNEKLESLFDNFCKYDESQKDSVRSIISSVHGHTLVVELIARQAKASMKTPEEMLKMLNERGILGLDTETVKWDFRKGTVADHVRGLFSISNMNEEQVRLMCMMAFMPVDGVDEKLFCDYYGIENHSDIRYLIDNGWISEQYGLTRRILMHPVIASIVLDYFIAEEQTADSVYTAFFDTMVRLAGKESENKDQLFAMCRSIALQTDSSGIRFEKAADFLARYANYFARYGNIEERRNFLLKAIDIYEALYGPDEYVAVRESAYESYVGIINDVNHVSEVNHLCNEHMKKAKKNRDIYMQGRWYIRKNDASHVKNKTTTGFSLMYIVYTIKIVLLANKLEKESKKGKRSLISQGYLEKLHYGYMCKRDLQKSLLISVARCYEDYSENNVFFTKDDWFETYHYKTAIGIRNRFKNAHSVNSSSNSINKVIDLAKLDILSRNYDGALVRLQEIVEYFEKNNIPEDVNYYNVRGFIGAIALTTGDYQRAISEYTACLELANTLNLKKYYGIRVNLAKAYAMNGEIEESKKVNLQLYIDLKEVDRDNRGPYFAEMYYNVAYRYLLLGNQEEAERFFLHSIKQFQSSSIYGNRMEVGIARSRYQLGKLRLASTPEEAALYVKQAYDSFQSCLGDKHIETIECNNLLKECEPYLRKKK